MCKKYLILKSYQTVGSLQKQVILYMAQHERLEKLVLQGLKPQLNVHHNILVMDFHSVEIRMKMESGLAIS